MLLMAVDFSTKIGVAVGRRGETPRLISKRLADWEERSISDVARQLMDWFPELLAVYKPDIVLIEAALTPAASRNASSARISLGGDFVLKGCVSRVTSKCYEVHQATWKKDILGSGHLSKEQAKPRSMEIARSFGLEPASNDESDAFCIWLYGMRQYLNFRTPAMDQVLARAQRKLI